MKVFCFVFILFVGACDQVPREAVELSATVGRDLEEVHRAHLALAELHFQQSKDAVNGFIDNTYRPAYIARFAREFDLPGKVSLAIEKAPNELLPGLTLFVRTAYARIEKKRNELLEPIKAQEREVINEINAAHKQLQAAQAIVTGHLASVRKVRDVQNELLAKAGLKDLREKIATRTAEVSVRVGELVERGEEISIGIDDAVAKINQIDAKIGEFVKKFEKE